eukprot:11849809-Prorocentrum_lima.AAC.1
MAASGSAQAGAASMSVSWAASSCASCCWPPPSRNQGGLVGTTPSVPHPSQTHNPYRKRYSHMV